MYNLFFTSNVSKKVHCRREIVCINCYNNCKYQIIYQLLSKTILCHEKLFHFWNNRFDFDISETSMSSNRLNRLTVYSVSTSGITRLPGVS